MAENGLLDEIFVALGFKVDDKKVKDFDNSLKTTLGSLRRLITVAGGAVIALDRMTNAMMRTNQAYINFNQQTGLSIDNMNKLIGAGMLANYSLTPESMMNSIQALQSNLAAISIGQGNIAPFQILGVSPVGKNAIQIMEELRVALKGVDDAMAVNLIQQMGLSPETLSLLRLTTGEMARLNAAANKYMLNEKQRESLNQFAMELRLVHMEMSYLKDKALIAIGPHLIAFLDRFTKVLEVMFEYRKVLMWIGAGGILAIMNMNKAIKILGITINATFGKWLAALTAIYLILEDLAIWKMGGQSLIGDLYEWSQRGFSRDPDTKTSDELYEEAYDKKRTAFDRYVDWFKGGGFFGTLTGGGKRTHDDLQRRAEFQKQLDQYGGFWGLMQHEWKSLLLPKTSSNIGNVSANQNMQQTNYFTFGNSPSGVLAAANEATNLMFTMMQFDRST